MYNLVSFPHYTCGGLLCDILNNNWSSIGTQGNILSTYHSLGKIGDSDTVFTEFNLELLQDRISQLTTPHGSWIGSHCWPTKQLTNIFDNIILVSTATSRSQIYRWARAYHHFFKSQWEHLVGMEKIDKMRETAKNYVIPFEPVQTNNVENLEFADVVDATAEFFYLVRNHNYTSQIERWQKVNCFLYDENFWNSDVVKSFYQAEHEVKLGRYYRYE
jgi:hypothetical protein